MDEKIVGARLIEVVSGVRQCDSVVRDGDGYAQKHRYSAKVLAPTGGGKMTTNATTSRLA